MTPLERWATERREYFAEIEHCSGIESPFNGFSSLRVARDKTFVAADAAREVLGHWPTDADL